jgi:hypothetical protein
MRGTPEPQTRSAEAHDRASCVRELVAATLTRTTQEALLLHTTRSYTHHLFSDWGYVFREGRGDLRSECVSGLPVLSVIPIDSTLFIV